MTSPVRALRVSGWAEALLAASVMPLVVERASVTLVFLMVRVMYRWLCR